jgi:phosphoribosyl 1,2-cyclic phosphate phosphodiesterase
MKVHFLGTAAAEGFPNPYCSCDTCERARQLKGRDIRMRCSAIIDGVLKVDYPPDSYAQALRDGVEMGRITDLLLTHTHFDHLAPGDLISRMTGYAHGIEQPLNVYGNDLAIYQCRLALLEEGSDGGQFNMMRLLPFHTYQIGEANVTPLLADHDPKETCLLYFIEKDGKTLLYGNDSGWFPEATWSWLQGKKLDGAILDCTVGKTGNKYSRNHMSVETVIEAQKQMKEMNLLNPDAKLVVTHFSHNGGLLYDDLVEIFDPYQIVVAYDSMVLNI